MSVAQRCNAIDTRIGVATELAAESYGKLPQRNGHNGVGPQAPLGAAQ